MAQKMSSLEKSLKKLKEQLPKYAELFSEDFVRSKGFKEERLLQLLQVTAKHRGIAEGIDLPAQRMAKREQRDLEKQVYGNSWTKRLFYRGLNQVKAAYRNRQEVRRTDKNEAEVTVNLRKIGLPQTIDQVKEQMKKGLAEISVPVAYQLSENRRMELTVQVKQDEQGRYRVEQFKAAIQDAGGEKRAHVFKTEAGQSFTAMQAQNLLEGRAVKTEYMVEGMRHTAWVQLDLNDKTGESYQQKRFEENYGFDLGKQLDKLPLAIALTPEKREMLLHDLENGKKVPVVLNQDMVEKTFFIQADPGKKSIAVMNTMGVAQKRDTAIIRQMNTGQKNNQEQGTKTKVRTMQAMR